MGRVVAAGVYSSGCRVADIDLADAHDWSVKADHFVWLGFHEPDEADLRQIQHQFGLHDLAIEDALNAHQRPKLELYGDTLFIVLRTAQLIDEHVEFGETHIFVGRGYVVTVRHGPSTSYRVVRERAEACPALLRHGEDYVLYAVLDFVVDKYFPVIEAIEAELGVLESRILSRKLDYRDAERIYELRRELLRLRNGAAPMAEVCKRLVHLDFAPIDKSIRPYYRDVVDHVKRLNESIDGLREVLGFAFEASHLLESSRQNEISRRFAGWAAILAVPTAIAGIYGMNFEEMPELKMRFGYPAVILFILSVCGYLYYRFRRAGWL